jgi:1-acyl-sn-glycerol-3-phosphate acyltransferase
MKWVYRIPHSILKAFFRIYFQSRFFHPEHVPTHGPVILAANHASFLDPPLIGTGIHREINFLARESLFRFPLFGSMLRIWNVVPVDRDGAGAKGLRAILDRLLAGNAVIVFPEGTRTPNGRLQSARAGIGLTVIKSDAPVIPVRVVGSFAAWGRHRLFPLPKPVQVHFGTPMTFTQFREEAKQCSKERLKQIYQEIANELMEAIRALAPDANS